MEYKKAKSEIYILKNFLFVLFIVFCIQFTELKLDVIKLSELLLLLLTPFIYLKKINKWILFFLVLFIFWFVQTILFNPIRSFFLLENVSILKRPYLISIGRFLELISCVNLSAIIILVFKNKSKEEKIIFIKYIFDFSFFLMIVNVVFYYSYLNNIIENTRMVYWGDRLRGWFGEGGPYGLMLSFTYVLTFFYKSKYHNLKRFLIILVIYFLAKSKAGVVLVLIWYFIIYYKTIYKKLKEFSIIIVIMLALLFSLIFVKLSKNYIYAISNVKKEMKERPTDINLVMGRIAGVFIFPEMIADYPIFGIGLGNYPIMRNNPKYLEFIPKSPKGKTDAHGFGGLIQLLVDGGLVVFILFAFIIYYLYVKIKRKKNKNENFLAIFLFFFIFGVQIYFLYPWVLLGILISLNEKRKINE